MQYAATIYVLPPNSATNAGRRLPLPDRSAEYKQVTVLFADIVRSMDIAAAVGPERLREIMTELVITIGRWRIRLVSKDISGGLRNERIQ